MCKEDYRFWILEGEFIKVLKFLMISFGSEPYCYKLLQCTAPVFLLLRGRHFSQMWDIITALLFFFPFRISLLGLCVSCYTFPLPPHLRQSLASLLLLLLQIAPLKCASSHTPTRHPKPRPRTCLNHGPFPWAASLLTPRAESPTITLCRGRSSPPGTPRLPTPTKWPVKLGRMALGSPGLPVLECQTSMTWKKPLCRGRYITTFYVSLD